MRQIWTILVLVFWMISVCYIPGWSQLSEEQQYRALKKKIDGLEVQKVERPKSLLEIFGERSATPKTPHQKFGPYPSTGKGEWEKQAIQDEQKIKPLDYSAVLKKVAAQLGWTAEFRKADNFGGAFTGNLLTTCYFSDQKNCPYRNGCEDYIRGRGEVAIYDYRNNQTAQKALKGWLNHRVNFNGYHRKYIIQMNKSDFSIPDGLGNGWHKIGGRIYVVYNGVLVNNPIKGTLDAWIRGPNYWTDFGTETLLITNGCLIVVDQHFPLKRYKNEAIFWQNAAPENLARARRIAEVIVQHIYKAIRK